MKPALEDRLHIARSFAVLLLETGSHIETLGLTSITAEAIPDWAHLLRDLKCGIAVM
jgi:hypothetical protein